ncbi:MAG: toxin-antitoxin system YwqK family antitoxin [Myxococcota bacterium]
MLTVFIVSLVLTPVGQAPPSGKAEITCPSDGTKKSSPVKNGRAVWCEAPNFFGGTARNGPYREYRSNGTLRWAGQFINGRPDGRWKRFGPGGQVVEERTYVNGRMASQRRAGGSAGEAGATGARVSPGSRDNLDIASQEGPNGEDLSAFEGPDGEDLSEFEGLYDEDPVERSGAPRTEPPAQRAFGFPADDDLGADRVPYQTSVGLLRKGQSSVSVGGAFLYFFPLFDLSYRYGIERFLAFDMALSTAGIYNFASLGLTGKVYGNETFSANLRLAFETQAFFPSVYDLEELGGLVFDNVLLGPKPGLGVSFGTSRFQISAGFDAPFTVFAVAFFPDEISQLTGIDSVSGSGFTVSVRPSLTAELKLGRKKTFFTEVAVDTLVHRDDGVPVARSSDPQSSEPLSTDPLVLVTLGVTFDVGASTRRFDRFDRL